MLTASCIWENKRQLAGHTFLCPVYCHLHTHLSTNSIEKLKKNGHVTLELKYFNLSTYYFERVDISSFFLYETFGLHEIYFTLKIC